MNIKLAEKVLEHEFSGFVKEHYSQDLKKIEHIEPLSEVKFWSDYYHKLKLIEWAAKEICKLQETYSKELQITHEIEFTVHPLKLFELYRELTEAIATGNTEKLISIAEGMLDE